MKSKCSCTSPRRFRQSREDARGPDLLDPGPWATTSRMHSKLKSCRPGMWTTSFAMAKQYCWWVHRTCDARSTLEWRTASGHRSQGSASDSGWNSDLLLLPIKTFPCSSPLGRYDWHGQNRRRNSRRPINSRPRLFPPIVRARQDWVDQVYKQNCKWRPLQRNRRDPQERPPVPGPTSGKELLSPLAEQILYNLPNAKPENVERESRSWPRPVAPEPWPSPPTWRAGVPTSSSAATATTWPVWSRGKRRAVWSNRGRPQSPVPLQRSSAAGGFRCSCSFAP